MNIDNKIVVSSSPRALNKQLSNGVEDVHKAEHFPALPNATLPDTSQRKLSRWSSSFKGVIDKQPEAQALPVVPEASVASSSSSPRIGARYEQAEPEITQAQPREQDVQSVEAGVQQVSCFVLVPLLSWQGNPRCWRKLLGRCLTGLVVPAADFTRR